jgi:hypothetical protein
LETGRTTARMVLVFSSIRTETSTRECGRETEDMVKELTGEMKLVNLEENTLEIGLKTRSMAEELSSIRMAIDMTDTGSMANHKVKVE